uniref:Centromere protein H n=1 Tax=Leptobrachium leishanense TaxID=445787 RepID=A0A8C5M497_9ANUR
MDPTSELNPSLAKLHLQSTELGRVAMMGAGEQEEENQAKADLINLLRLREQLKQQNLELQCMAIAGDSSSDVYPGEILKEAATELQDGIANAIVSYNNKTKVLQRIQSTDALLAKVEERSRESRLLQDNLTHITELSSVALSVQWADAAICWPNGVTAVQVSMQDQLGKSLIKDTRKLEEKLTCIKRKRYDLKQAACNILTEIDDFQKRTSDLQKIESTNTHILEVLKKEKNFLTIVQNAFQHLLLGSRVNWAEDPKLRDLVLKLEKNPIT